MSCLAFHADHWIRPCIRAVGPRQSGCMCASDPNTSANARPSGGCNQCDESEKQSAADLLPVIYDELRRLAAHRLAHLPPGQTLQPTALVHDVFLRIVGERDPGWHGRAHFFGAAAKAMRNILVDQARRKSAVKHGGDRRRVAADDWDIPDMTEGLPIDEILALDEVIEQLATDHPRPAQVVMLRYFAGLTSEQVAEALDIGLSTVKRDWRFACAWLRRAMEGEAPTDA